MTEQEILIKAAEILLRRGYDGSSRKCRNAAYNVSYKYDRTIKPKCEFDNDDCPNEAAYLCVEIAGNRAYSMCEKHNEMTMPELAGYWRTELLPSSTIGRDSKPKRLIEV